MQEQKLKRERKKKYTSKGARKNRPLGTEKKLFQ